MADKLAAPDLDALLKALGVDLWGAAANDPPLPRAPVLATAISLLVRFTADELAGVESGPTPAYYAGYCRANETLNAAAAALVAALTEAGFHAEAVPATVPEEECAAIEDWCAVPVFAHKTAATRAGLGWIGKTALFVSPVAGPRVRLATVFTDLELTAGTPVEVGRCGACILCVDACPAGAGVDVTWHAGMPRGELYDAKACEVEIERYLDLGGVCGVCIAVCPWGRKSASNADNGGGEP